jgi:hypothetical protein
VGGGSGGRGFWGRRFWGRGLSGVLLMTHLKVAARVVAAPRGILHRNFDSFMNKPQQQITINQTSQVVLLLCRSESYSEAKSKYITPAGEGAVQWRLALVAAGGGVVAVPASVNVRTGCLLQVCHFA